MRRALVLGLLAVVLVWASVASGNVVTGLGRHSSYSQYNHLYQWEFGASAATSRTLGTVDLEPLFSNEDRGFRDIAVLSDRRVAVIHMNSAGDTWQTSVLTMQYDGTGLLTGATVDATVDNTHIPVKIAPVPDGGFVTIQGGSAVVWEQTAPNAWASTLVTGMSSNHWDVAGLINPAGDQFVTGQYVTPPGGTAARSGHKYDKTGKLASYYNSDMTSLQAWGYGGSSLGEGLRHPLFDNGWVTTGYSGNSYETYVYDGTQTDGAWHDGFVGEITNSDGTPIYDRNVAALDDGRVVIWFGGGYGQTQVTFRVYSLVQDPGGRVGTIGANGEDFEVSLAGNFPNLDRDGWIAGDYMVEPAGLPIAEPGALGLMLLGLPVLLRRRPRRGSKMLVCLLLVGLVFTSAASANVVSGFHYYGGYGVNNTLYQWEIGTALDGSDTRPLGTVDLVAVLGYDPKMSSANLPNGDIAMLSDRRVVLTHVGSDGSTRVVSVLSPTYDGSGLLTGATVDATISEPRGKSVAPLPNGGFVCVSGGASASAVVYQQTGPNTWAASSPISGMAHCPDVAGLVVPGDTVFTAGEYSRKGEKYNQSGLMAIYDDGARGWGYSNGSGEGVRPVNVPLANPWIITGEDQDGATTIGSVIFDGTESDGGTYNGKKGEVLNSDGSPIYRKRWAALDDGRVVTPWLWGYGHTGVTWRVYTPILNPALQPAGSVGATGEDFQTFTPGNLVGVVAGDYMYVAPEETLPIPEPGTIGLLILGSALGGLMRRRRRAR